MQSLDAGSLIKKTILVVRFFVLIKWRELEKRVLVIKCDLFKISQSFGFLMKKVQSHNCLLCNKIEDVYHLLVECVLKRVCKKVPNKRFRNK